MTATATTTGSPFTVRAGAAVTAKAAGGPRHAGDDERGRQVAVGPPSDGGSRRPGSPREGHGGGAAGPGHHLVALRTVRGLSVESRTPRAGTGVVGSSKSSIRISVDSATDRSRPRPQHEPFRLAADTTWRPASRPPSAAHAEERTPPASSFHVVPPLARKIRRNVDSTMRAGAPPAGRPASVRASRRAPFCETGSAPYSTCMGTGRPRASVASALRTTLDLFDTGVKLKYQSLRRSQPGASEAELEQQLRRWLLDRPGAESGDSPGRRIAWNEGCADLARRGPEPHGCGPHARPRFLRVDRVAHRGR